MIRQVATIFCFSLLALGAVAQIKNTSTEVIDYREADGKIILGLIVNGEPADFVLDLAGHTAVLPEYLEKLKIDPESQGSFGTFGSYLYKQVPVGGVVKIASVTLGNSAFGSDLPAFVLQDEPYLRKLGVAGVVSGTLFQHVVLTIDSRRKKITISSPYRPPYMRLDHRSDLKPEKGGAVSCRVTVAGQPFQVLLDTWSDGLLDFTPGDYKKVKGRRGVPATAGAGYAEPLPVGNAKMAANLELVKSSVEQAVVTENQALSRSVLGRGILEYGILSVDWAKQRIYFQHFDLVAVKDEVQTEQVVVADGKMNPINKEYFIDHIFDYRKGQEFVYRGDKPVVIDFWATWCGPCMRMMPEMEKMAEKYKGEVVFLKVNADKEKELCNVLNVQALPTMYFLPVGEKPIIDVGALPEKYEQIIREKLLKR